MDIALGISGLAVLISLISLYNSIATRRDTARAQAIRDSYAIFYELDRLHMQNWQLAHLFVTPDQYESVSSQVANLKKYTVKEKNELLIKERAIAYFVFDIYEHTLYQWRQATRGRDTGRAYFLTEVLDYLSNKTLRNPRLLYYWSHAGEHYEGWTHQFYKDNVLSDPDNPLIYKQDETGPFALTRKTRR
jgi:hypothetical protein